MFNGGLRVVLLAVTMSQMSRMTCSSFTVETPSSESWEVQKEIVCMCVCVFFFF